MLYEIFSNAAYTETPFDVVVMDPQKTFLEKLFLLHEEFLKPGAGRQLRTERMSRHLYDIEKLMNTEFGKKALANQDLYDAVIAHREKYSRYNWMDYSTLGKKTIFFLPPEEMYEQYKNDYAEMKEHMFFRDSKILEYNNLINRLKELQERIRES